MKKGFTLVELIGIFTLMAIILIIAAPSVTNMLKKAKENEYYSFEENIFLATEAYISSNKNNYLELRETDKLTYVRINNLLMSNYLDSNIINPVTKKKISEEANQVVIIYMNNKKLYVYELIKNVKDEETAAINAYEALTKDATNEEVEAVKTLVAALEDGSIKTALQNKSGE